MTIAEWQRIIEAEARRLGMSFEHYLACVFLHSELSRRFTLSCLEDDAFRASVELTKDDLKDD